MGSNDFDVRQYKHEGKLAYDGYCAHTGGKSLITGDQLPPFEELKTEIQLAWMAAAKNVVDDILA